MQMESKIQTEDELSSRAVSPVIGVILMVAITVILAAVIAAFVLDLGQSSGANPSAGYTIDGDGTDTTIQITSIDRLDQIGAFCDDRSSMTLEDAEVGETYDVSGDCGDDPQGSVTVIGEYDGSEATL
ncbi:type IV pilin N-terminal domain-containing protein [Halobacteria archaeon AArc-curdl1]|uniref:Type IV pilin N-terminal domain-containing protein n=1 Tax=Natronosalvus hydrolyticus TaxID=2979988 RepID=A0AAP3E7K6_9EURY|nr:type IV pilin N-terminal domain-containing protein [Halobacteria archaeon AArc-curdl1]